MKYLYVIEKGKRNYSAYVPDLPGCVAAGKTKAETEKLIKQAIEFHLEGMLLNGETIPHPGSTFLGYYDIKPPVKINKPTMIKKKRVSA